LPHYNLSSGSIEGESYYRQGYGCIRHNKVGYHNTSKQGGKMATQKVLLPYNFTPHDRKAMDFVIRFFAHQKDVAVTIFAAFTPVPEIKTGGAPIMEKLNSGLIHLQQIINDQEANLQDAVQVLIKGGFSKDGVSFIFKPRKTNIASEIIQLVKFEHFNIVVLNHKPGKATHFFTGNAYNKIVNALHDTCICVVT
jgi:hypothetical protein